MYFDWCCEFIYDCASRYNLHNHKRSCEKHENCENQSGFRDEDKELIKSIC